MIIDGLFWHCLNCGAHDAVESTGDPANEYGLGDWDMCVECCEGTTHVMTIKMAACYEQGVASGHGVHSSWERAKELAANRP